MGDKNKYEEFKESLKQYESLEFLIERDVEHERQTARKLKSPGNRKTSKKRKHGSPSLRRRRSSPPSRKKKQRR